MLHIFWTFLNILAFLFLIFLCVRFTSVVRQKLGLLAAVVFVVCLLSFANKGENKSSPQKSYTMPDDMESSYFAETTLEKTPITKFDLTVVYGRKKSSNDLVVLSSSAVTTGLISGIEREVVLKSITPGADKQSLNYIVSTNTEWKLLGITLYSQERNFQGVIPLKN